MSLSPLFSADSKSRWNVSKVALSVALLTALLLGGCNSGNEQGEPNILRSFPAEWTPLAPESNQRFSFLQPTSYWQPVSIDGDQDDEFLVFYTYDNSANGEGDGPVGALIYDFQDTSEFVVGQPSLPIPLQPSGNFVPYRLLPSYWEGLDGAFISPTGGDSARRVVPVRRAPPTPLAPPDSSPYNELVVIGGGGTLTFVWWRNIFDGYGVTQIRGPAGFRNINDKDNLSMDDWAGEESVINQIDALFPLNGALRSDGRPSPGSTAAIDRSLLCHVVRYLRAPVQTTPSTVAGSVYQEDITYNASPKGIQFCRANSPRHPFYPEGVVLQYLLKDDVTRRALMAPALDKTEQDDLLKATLFDSSTEWIADLATRRAIDYPESFRTTQPPDLPDSNQPTLTQTRRLMTQVCVEIQPNVVGAQEPRLLYFSLVNEPPTINLNEPPTATGDAARNSDRLWITYVEDATGWGAANCTELVQLDASFAPSPGE